MTASRCFGATGTVGSAVTPSRGSSKSMSARQRSHARHSGKSASARTRYDMPRPMDLLREVVPITIIALWLGHQSVESTMKYLHADPKIKEDAMERTRRVDVPPGRYQPERNRSWPS